MLLCSYIFGNFLKVFGQDKSTKEFCNLYVTAERDVTLMEERILLKLSPNENEAVEFTIKGSKHNHVKIYTTVEGRKFYWTWSRNEKFISLKEDETPFQNFVINMDFGEHLFALYVVGEESKAVKLDGSEIVTSRVRLGEKTLVFNCKEAPTDTTFMMLPPTNDTTFYLGLNNFVNSLRFKDEEKHLIKCDLILDKLIHNLKTNDEKMALHVSTYCLCILARSTLTKIKITNTKEVVDDNFHFLKEICAEFVEKNNEFKEKLKGINSKEAITPEQYTNYLKKLLKCFEEKKPRKQRIAYAVNLFWRLLLEGVISAKSKVDVQLEKLRSSIHEYELELPVGEEILDYFGTTNTIIKSCLTRYKDQNQISGHMAIIRMMRVKSQDANPSKHGNLMKQSLCVARHVAGELDLEIIQDYSASGTLSAKLQDHIETASVYAQQLQNPCLLRILRKIQVNQCQKKDAHGVLACDCKSYVENETNPYDLSCTGCGHVHRTFESYSDLIGLPCLLILVNNGSMGDTFPPSLCAIDDRMNYVNIDNAIGSPPYLSQFTQEKGRLCRYTTLNSNLPIMYLSVKFYGLLLHSLRKHCSYYHFFVEKKSVDPKLKWNDKKGEFDVIKGHVDSKKDNKQRHHHMILIAEPQTGKTGVYLKVSSI